MKLRLMAFAAGVAALLTLALGAGRADADNPAQTFAVEFPFSLFSPCPPHELINFTVSLRGVIHEHEDSSHFILHESFTLKGESVSGVQYVGTGVENTSIQAERGYGGEGAITFTDEETQTYIARGEPSEADDFLAHHVIHVTMNANGEVTAQVITEHTECK